MKRLTYLFVPAVLLLAAACTHDFSEEFPSRRTVSRSFVATLDDSSTRTARDAEGHTVWQQGDEILYFGNVTAQKSLILASGGSSVTMQADLSQDDTCITAVYGASAVLKPDFSKNTFSLSGVIPYEQDGSFGKANVSVAHNDLKTGNLAFKNITSMVKFELTRSDVAYAILSTGAGEALHGDGTVDVSFNADGCPVAALAGTTGPSIRLNLNGAGTYYVSVLPQTWSQGFELKCFDKDGKRIGVAAHSGSVVIKSNFILNLGQLEPKHLTLDSAEDLSGSQTANCYIASELGVDYRFNATVQGNSTNFVGGVPDSAEVLWKTSGTTVPPETNEVVTGVSLEGSYVHFTTVSNGSAIIAVKSGDNILWSWHIWVWEGFDADANSHVYANDAGIMMDRNLGAILAGPGDGVSQHGSSGLLYQWGRKDPFPGRSSSYTGVVAEECIPSSAQTGTVEYSIAHPTHFISYTDENTMDWIYGDSRMDGLWAAAKTEYDPCPPGWQVPSISVWTIASGIEGTFFSQLDFADEGMEMSGKYAPTYPSVWYPATGLRLGTDNPYVMQTSEYAIWWSYNTVGKNARVMYLRRSNQVQLGSSVHRSMGGNVRCSREITQVESVSLNYPGGITLECYASMNLKASVYPDYAFNKTLEWSSDKPAIVSVDSATGRITARRAGNATITVKSLSNPSATASVDVTVNPSTLADLSDKGDANCYIVDRPGSYKFAAHKGNSGEEVEGAVYADILWQTYGTDTYNANKPVIRLDDDAYAAGYIFFNVPTDMRDGNALIAVYDAQDNILWSWHIWVCRDFDPDSSEYHHAYANDAGTLMDRNLGATTATMHDATSYGLLYQWGRKDPFLGARNTFSLARAVSSRSEGDWPGNVSSNAVNGTMEYAVSHPMTFIEWDGDSSGWDWCHAPNDANPFWSSSKTMYDPCPAGWRVPDGGPNGVWMTALGNPEGGLYYIDYDEQSGGGIDFTGKMGAGNIYYPDAGFMHRQTGALQGTSQYFLHWSCTVSGKRAYCFYHYHGAEVSPGSDFFRACAASVRCMKE